MDETALDSVLEEQEAVDPPRQFVANAVVSDPAATRAQAEEDPEALWAEAANDLEWFRPWDRVVDWQAPDSEWFPGGRCNIVHNAIDRHLHTWRRHKVALIWEGENGDRQVLTYAELARDVNKLASALRAAGVAKGDRITLYMGVSPQLAISMLASAKIGAIHSVVFGGFSAAALRDRIQDAEAKVLITADGAYYRG